MRPYALMTNMLKDKEVDWTTVARARESACRATAERFIAAKSPKMQRIMTGQILKYNTILHYLPKPSKILDVCTGSGFGASMLAVSGHDVIGIDGDARFAKKRENIEVTETDIFEWETEDQYDGVTFIDAIEHFGEDVQKEVIPKLWGWLKPGGVLVIDTPYTRRSRRASRHHKWELSWEDFEDLVRNGGEWEEVLERYSTIWNGYLIENRRCFSKPEWIKNHEQDQIIVARKKNE